MSLDTARLVFWGYIKKKMQINKPQTIEDLNEEIWCNIDDVSQQLC